MGHVHSIRKYPLPSVISFFPSALPPLDSLTIIAALFCLLFNLIYASFYLWLFMICLWQCCVLRRNVEGWLGWVPVRHLCGTLPKLTKRWSITPSVVSDLWLMVFGQKPGAYLLASFFCMNDNGQTLRNSTSHFCKQKDIPRTYNMHIICALEVV